MEKMPYQTDTDTAQPPTVSNRSSVVSNPSSIVSSDWRDGLPTLSAGQVVLRELRISDAPSLLALLPHWSSFHAWRRRQP